MATTVTNATCTLAMVKVDAAKLTDILSRGQYPANVVSPGFIALLQSIASSADTTDLRTT